MFSCFLITNKSYKEQITKRKKKREQDKCKNARMCLKKRKGEGNCGVQF